ncbi:MAG: hypothetical protein GQ477_02375 [Nanohaloarchaea archaeon]|nr:hypothetical protein [Candidatus Nanohaloarchaea archaeon]
MPNYSHDDLEQVIDHIKPDNGSRIGFIYHVLTGFSGEPIDKLQDIKYETGLLVTPKPQSYEDYKSNPSKPVLNPAGDCGHLWIYNNDEGQVEFQALLPSDKVPIWLTEKRLTLKTTLHKNEPHGVRSVRYLNVKSPDEHFSNTSVSDIYLRR